MNRHTNNQLPIGGNHIVKRALIVSIAVVALLALCAVPAFAEGYNNGSWNFTSLENSATYAANAGIYVRTPHAGATQVASFAGPHGGYTTTTNKCQDCHSTHYATGSYMLLRNNSRETACDFCHTGGGGSTTNIQMDNQYSATSLIPTATMGFGTGHTLGYAGMAPADIEPAFQDAGGLACFDCHSPHGNSARILGTFADPGRPIAANDTVQNVYRMNDAWGTVALAGPISMQTAATTLGTVAGMLWGISPTTGNIIIYKAKTVAEGGTGAMAVQNKPVWPAGRFLLLKSPDVNDGSDTRTAGVGVQANSSTGNKLAISWDDPIGPADGAYGGNDAARSANPAWNNSAATNHPWPKGLNAESEVCADCHDGTAGLSNQAAKVWKPDPSDSTDGTYMVAYSHDAQPRH